MFLILLALLVVPQSSALSELFLPSPSLSPTCSVSNVIDVIQMQCAACVSGTVPVSTTTCGCSNTFIYSDATLSGCMACPSGRVASFDRTFCLACPTTINAVTGYCVCGTRQYFRDTNATGSPAANGVCVDCPVYAYPSSDLSYCQSCPEPTNMVSALVNGVYQCQCMTDRGFERVPQGNKCVKSSNLQSIQQQYSTMPYRITFQDMIAPTGSATTMSIESDILEKNLYSAIAGCMSMNVTSCEQLGNLCVLQLYDKKTAACLAYQNLAKSRPVISSVLYDRPQGIPWLYYGLLSNEDPATTARKSPDIRVDVSSGSGVSMLPFVMSVYSVNGTFLGLQNLTTQLEYCEDARTLKESWRRIGVNYAAKCQINLSNLVKRSRNTLLFDLFIQETSGTLYPVPVRLLNYRSNGNLINKVSDPLDFSNNQLVRRFFQFDFASGVDDGLLKIIRAPVQFNFWVLKSGSDNGRIQVPVMDILYTEREISSISSTDNSAYSSPEFSFNMTYAMSLVDFWQALKIALAVVLVLGVLYGFYRAKSYGYRNIGPTESIDIKFLGRVLLFLTGSVGLLLFWFIFATCLYWYFFYKGQSVLYLVLPYKSDDIAVLMMGLAIVLICEVVYVTRELYRQCKADIFLIDWEKSRGQIASSHEQNSTQAPVSVWRSIFMANQWNNLQPLRRVNIEFTVIFAVVLLDGLNWRYTASSQPNINTLVRAPVNPILLFAIDTLVWLALAVIQLVFRSLIYNRFYRNKLLQFVDVLSVANVSLLAFDELCHGYYVHGRSVHGSSDVNMDELNHSLRKEEADLVPKRGLQDTNQQSFEVFTTSSFRSTFDKIYAVVASTQMTKNVKLSFRASKNTQVPIKGAPETSIKAYLTINKFLCSLLENNLKEFMYMIRSKGYFEKMFGANPDLSQGLIFFPDETGFSSLLLYGMEWHLLVLYMTLFGLLDILLDCPIEAGVIVYFLDVVVRMTRRHFGEKNISSKSLLDSKFLL